MLRTSNSLQADVFSYFSSCAMLRHSSDGFVRKLRKQGLLTRAAASAKADFRFRMMFAAFDAQANNNGRNFGQAGEQWLRRLYQPTERELFRRQNFRPDN
jgi:hypothetical protein